MYTTNRPNVPVDRNIDIRMRLLGVFGFLLLAGLFFIVGFLCIGQRWKSSHSQTTPPQASANYVPPQEHREAVDEEQPKEEGPDINLEVTELEENAPPQAEDFADGFQSPDDVKVDEDGLTITLGDKRKRSADRVDDKHAGGATDSSTKETRTEKAVPAKRTSAQPKAADEPKSTAGSKIEKSRVATEKRDVMYRVQAGSYSTKSTADDLAAKLKRDGYRRATVTQVQVKDRTLYRVQVAEYKTVEDAQELSRDLKATGYQPAIVSN